MKKTIGFVLVMFFLCTICLSAAAAYTDVENIFRKTETALKGYVSEYEIRCLHIPASINPAIFADLKVEIEGAEEYIDTVASLEIPESDATKLIIIPKEEEYVDPICDALLREVPLLDVKKEASAETGEIHIVVSLPEMNKDLYDTCEKLLNAYDESVDKKIDLLKAKTLPEIIGAGGTEADKDALNELYENARKEKKALTDKYDGYIKARYELFLEEHPEEANLEESGNVTASSLSKGSLAVIVGVLCFAVGFLVSMFIFKKKDNKCKP